MPTWTISKLEDSDLHECSDINIAAFGDSDINRYLRPPHLRRNDWDKEERSASERRRFQPVYKGIAAKACTATGDIGGFAAWRLEPAAMEAQEGQTNSSAAAVQDPEIDIEAKARFWDWLDTHLRRIMANEPHWYLNVIATNPSYLRQGAASALIEWGLKQAAAQGMPTILAAAPHAVPVYLKSGLEIVETLRLDCQDIDSEGKAQGQRVIELMIMVKKA